VDFLTASKVFDFRFFIFRGRKIKKSKREKTCQGSLPPQQLNSRISEFTLRRKRHCGGLFSPLVVKEATLEYKKSI
jgi:hypothetical protein